MGRERGEGESPHLPILVFTRLKENKHGETNRIGVEGGEEAVSLAAAEMGLTDVGILHPVEMPST